MPSTPNLVLPYPDLTNAPNAPADIQALAQALDVKLGGAWTAYAPALTATTTNPTLGTGGATSGRYIRIGDALVMGWAQINFGTSGVAAGSGIYRVTLPATALTATFIGDGRIQCAGAYTRVQILAVTGALDRVSLRYYAAAGTQPDATDALPNPWLANDEIRFSFAYEPA